MSNVSEGTTDADLPLRGVGIGGFRSLREVQNVGPLSKVTLLAGQNNAGKSNVLRFVSDFLTHPPGFDWHDTPQPPGADLHLQFAFRMPSAADLADTNTELGDLARVLQHPALRPVAGSEDIWLQYVTDSKTNSRNAAWILDREYLDSVLDAIGNDGAATIRRASSILARSSGGNRTDDLVRVLDSLFPFRPPKTARVEAFRQISATDGTHETETVDHNGQGLTKKLAELRDPPSRDYEAIRAKFDAINKFAQTVFEDDEVSVLIPASQDDIQIQQHGRVLPLSSMGTGIHQVIIIATAATVLDDTVLCIEEPEVNLHPLLQRKLVRYLSSATTNQYLIATHSAHMLDYERSCVVHVSLDSSLGTILRRATSPQEVSNVCADLGYRPSDLIQANSVIWVEGPSDRIYLRKWLEIVAPSEFIEGIHYSVMFYGGALLRHLTANDPSVDEFISLRRLNRNSAILIDSDRTTARQGIGATKTRVCAEFDRDDMPGFSWVTDCRTIENYVPADLLTAAVNAIHKRSTYEPPASKWCDPLRLSSPTGEAARPDKVKIARTACANWPSTDLDRGLRQRVEVLATFIRTANGITK